jgi:signal transduction histidine kinase
MVPRETSTTEPNILVLPTDVLSCLLAMALTAAVMQWRTRRLLALERVQHEDRLREHERLCDELHDMLVQSTQGFMLTVQAAASQVPTESSARPMLDHALERADKVLAEARERVGQLRRRGQLDRNAIS